jgi:Arm DNA-binding domain
MRRTMTDKGVAALRPRGQRYAVTDPELRGHWIRIQPSGSKSYCAVTRNPQGRQIWTHIGAADAMSIDEAREIARGILSRVRAGLPATEPKAETFAQVAANWRAMGCSPPARLTGCSTSTFCRCGRIGSSPASAAVMLPRCSIMSRMITVRAKPT